MKCADKYYYKIYKQTNKLTKKLFGLDIIGTLHLRYELKSSIQKVINKDISEITNEDIIKNKIGCQYAKYRTVSKVLEVLEQACAFKNFSIEEFENEC